MSRTPSITDRIRGIYRRLRYTRGWLRYTRAKEGDKTLSFITDSRFLSQATAMGVRKLDEAMGGPFIVRVLMIATPTAAVDLPPVRRRVYSHTDIEEEAS